ncbi:MAG: VOC family protein [Sphingobium sp.]|nr:VOC family protein [Sphingobium sp.]
MLIPKGFTTLFPYVFAEDAAAYVDFLAAALGGEIVDMNRADNGTVQNAQLRFNDTTIMVSEARDPWRQTYGTYYLYVEDADSAMARAVAAGGAQIMPVTDMPYGDRQGGLKDPRGNVWWISQHLPGADY